MAGGVRKAAQTVLAAGGFVPTAGRAAVAAGPVLAGHPPVAGASGAGVEPAAAVA